MSRTCKPNRRKLASAPLVEASAAVAGFDHADIYRVWKEDRTEQVYDAAAYTAVTDLHEDYQRYVAANFPRVVPMSDVEFGVMTNGWLKHIVKNMPVRRLSGVAPNFGACANLRLIEAVRAAA